MKDLHIESHDFNKMNLVTKISKRSAYDIYQCSKCGLTGKRHGLSEFITVSDKAFDKKAICISSPKKIQITYCRACGKDFANLTPSSVHNVVEPPVGYKNDEKGVWVMGNKEPVKVLYGEFTILSDE